MFMAKSIENNKLTMKLTLEKDKLLRKSPAKQSQTPDQNASVSGVEEKENDSEPEVTITVVPLCYSSTIPQLVKKTKTNSSNDVKKILMKRHFHVPKRNLNAHEFFKTIYRANVNDIMYFLRFVSIKSVDPADGKTLLMACLLINNSAKRRHVFNLLVNYGADMSGRDDIYNRDLIAWAAVNGRSRELNTILAETPYEIDYTYKDSQGFPYIHLAVMSGRVHTVSQIMNEMNKVGVPIDITDGMGLTPYILARKLGYTAVAQLLSEQGKASTHRNDELCFKSPREWSQIGHFQRHAERNRKFWSGLVSVLPLHEESELSIPIKKSDNVRMPSNLPLSASTATSQDILHSVLNVWSEQNLPTYRKLAKIPQIEVPAVVEKKFKKSQKHRLSHRSTVNS